MVATALNSQIVVYGATNGSVATATLNSFDTVGGSWSGPGLVAAYVPTTNSTSKSSKAPLGAIIGGVVGGLVLIAIVTLLVVRSRRNSARKAEASSVQNGKADNTTLGVTPQMQQGLSLVQQPLMQHQYQQQQQQYSLHQQYVPVSYSPVTEAYAVPPQQQNPVIFQSQQYGVDPSQQSYSYVPPTLAVLPQQQQQPNIFQPQPQVDVDSKPSYSQTVYTPSAATPQTPYTLVSQTHSSGTPSSPQYIEGHSNNQGYVA
ncbi:hypothetical protein BGZ80_000039 [Entomortierella chlamydospora]|uniref:Transmembrane protein n=1 Tax=Entomortierella chlamydospora TaxID=101097 RepID=A0A9P6N3D3_9FUNG|nr:hypothetical protein BGZ79_004113 [Entomortierella chlamydospora]KAG0022535.1 hypothetical protein BGZ80_000039 [Entomortierella chlamydospora]